MTLETMRIRVAENLTILSDDYSTINEGVVTSQGIDNRINDIYREELCLMLSTKFPDDFKQTSYPYPTYTVGGVVAGTTSGTSLKSTTDTFDNSMEGFYIQDPTSNTKYKIVTYVSATEVIVDNAADASIGNGFYVLGNEFTFGSDTRDLKEIIQVRIKYKSTDPFVVCDNRVASDVYVTEVSTKNPAWYPTTLNVGGIQKRAIGFFPAPTDYQGQWEMDYIFKPIALTATDEPILTNAGVSEALIYGATAWAFRLQKRWDDAQYYQGLYEKAKKEVVAFYRPRNRDKATQLRWSTRTNAGFIRSY